VSPEDRREYRLYLTEEGDHCAHEIQRHSDEWSRQLVEGFSEEERRAALTLLSRMSGNSDAL
jgi:DNA-binding MarR family transcriptional regulator